MNNKMISVIVPVYNSDAYLCECINSVIGQHYHDWEIILVDDHSTDSSFQICKDFSTNYTNISALKNEKKGVSSARNLGIKNASGNYIVFLDSDDVLKNDALELLMDTIEEHDFGMGTYCSLYTNGVSIKHPIRPFEGNIRDFLPHIYEYILTPILQGPCWKIFSKDIIDKFQVRFPEEMSYGEDAVFVYDYLLHVDSLKICEADVYTYRISDISLSHGFKPVKFYTNIMLDEKIQKLCDCFQVDTRDGSNRYIRDVFASLVNEASGSLNRRDAIKEIRKAASNERVKKAFITADTLDIKKTVIKQCVKYKMFGFLNLLGRLNSKY